MRKTTATGRLRWLSLFEREMNEKRTDHYYFASIVSEIACLPFRVWGKEPPEELRDIKTFLLTFADPEELEQKAKDAMEQRAIRDAELSRHIWLAGVGITLDEKGKPVRSEGPSKPQSTEKRSLPRGVKVWNPLTGKVEEPGESPPESTPEPSNGQEIAPVPVPNPTPAVKPSKLIAPTIMKAYRTRRD